MYVWCGGGAPTTTFSTLQMPIVVVIVRGRYPLRAWRACTHGMRAGIPAAAAALRCPMMTTMIDGASGAVSHAGGVGRAMAASDVAQLHPPSGVV